MVSTGDNSTALVEAFLESHEDVHSFLKAHSEASTDARCEVLLADLKQRWSAGEPTPAEDYIQRYPDLFANPMFRLMLIHGELKSREDTGDTVSFSEFAKRFPELGHTDFSLQDPQADSTDFSIADPNRESTPREVEATVSGSPIRSSVAPSRIRRFQAGDTFGDYEIEEEIARGGMGVVFKARQLSLNRFVALKMVLSSHLVGDTAHRRFQAEAEAAAKLEHPGIVPIYEVGEVEGQAFFSMGLVEGGSLAELDQPMSPREAAELVLQLAHAIHYAHTKNIVHRDIKPGNILVDAEGEPKLTDFGLAKELDQDSSLTQTGSLMGTPGYMSPEQVRSKSGTVGPLSDVYSLGAILYYLLVNRAPFVGPTIIDTVYQVLHRSPESLRQQDKSIPIDLATICEKCLEKNPEARYHSAHELAEELERFLDRRPITARRLSTTARGWRWCQRNPLVATLSFSTLALLVVGIFTTSTFAFLANGRANDVERQRELLKIQFHETSRMNDALLVQKGELEDQQRQLEEERTDLQQANEALEKSRSELAIAHEQAIAAETNAKEQAKIARNAERDAKKSARELQAYSRFLVEDVLAVARPKGYGSGMGADMTVRDALLLASSKLKKQFAGSPVAEARARHEIGVTLRHHDDLEAAEKQLRRAFELRMKHLGPANRETQSTLNSLAVCLDELGKSVEAERMFQDLVTLVEKLDPPDKPFLTHAKTQLGVQFLKNGQVDPAVSMLQEVVDEASGDAKSQAQLSLASALFAAGKRKRSIELTEQSIAELSKTYPLDNADLLHARRALARRYIDTGRKRQAEKILREVYESHVEQFGPLHRQTRQTLFDWARSLDTLGKTPVAIAKLQQLIELIEQHPRRESISTTTVKSQLGFIYWHIGYFDRAVDVYQDVLAQDLKALGPNEPRTLWDEHNLAMNYFGADKLAEAEKHFANVVEKSLEVEWDRDGSYLSLMEVLMYRGKLDEAWQHTERIQELWPHQPGAPPEIIFIHSLRVQGQIHFLRGEYDQALQKQSEAMALYDANGKASLYVLRCLFSLAKIEGKIGDVDAAQETMESLAMKYIKPRQGPDIGYRRQIGRDFRYLVEFFEEQNKPEKAAEWKQRLDKWMTPQVKLPPVSAGEPAA